MTIFFRDKLRQGPNLSIFFRDKLRHGLNLSIFDRDKLRQGRNLPIFFRDKLSRRLKKYMSLFLIGFLTFKAAQRGNFHNI